MTHHTQESFDALALELKYAIKRAQEKLDHHHPRRNKIVLEYTISLIGSFLGLMNETTYKQDSAWIRQEQYTLLRDELVSTRIKLNTDLIECMSAFSGRRPVDVI